MNALRPTLALARRELRGAFSRRRLFVFLMVWVGAMLILNYILLPEATRSFAELAGEAQQLLAIESMALLVGLCLAVPSLAAVSVTAERDQETLDQLRLTLLTDRAILRGKAIASMAAAVAFIIALMPVFAVAQFSVGLDNAQILELFVYVLTFTFMIVQFGLACSSYFKRALSALSASYLFLAMLMLLPVYMTLNGSSIWITNAGRGGALQVWSAAGQPLSLESFGFTYLSPSTALFTILRGAIPIWQIAIMCLLPLVIGFLANRVARRALVRASEPKSVKQTKLIKDEQVLLARRTTFPYYLIDPLKPRPPIPDGKNAMFVREFRWGLFQRATWMVRGTYLVFLLSLLIFAVNVINYAPSAQVDAFLILISIFAFAIPAAFGNAFTKEREQRNFDMLRMTLLNAREIIAGKVLGGVAVLAPAFAAMFVSGLLTNIFLPEWYFLTLCGFVTMATSIFEMISLSLFSSLISRRTSSSVTLGAVLSFFAMFAAYFATHIVWAIALLLDQGMGILVSGDRSNPPWWVSAAISPVTSYMQCFRPEYAYGIWRSVPYNFIGTWAAGQLVAVFIAAAMLVLSGAILIRYRMRDR